MKGVPPEGNGCRQGESCLVLTVCSFVLFVFFLPCTSITLSKLIYVFAYIYIYKCVYVCTYKCVYTYICTPIHTHIHTQVLNGSF